MKLTILKCFNKKEVIEFAIFNIIYELISQILHKGTIVIELMNKNKRDYAKN